tara:strand:+ start:795 stop:1034 length:240 start_codon:yes stop_codon:yes gene_type:complete
MKVQKNKIQIIRLPITRYEPWRDVPIEVLIEEERIRQESFEEHRERLYAPTPEPPRRDPPSEKDKEDIQEDDFKIVIKL